MSKKLCGGECSRELVAKDNFYNSKSKLHKDGKLPICKKCLSEMVDVNDINSVKNILRQIDKPFKMEIWQRSITSKRQTFPEYMRQINSLYADMTWDDGDGQQPEKAQPTQSFAPEQRATSDTTNTFVVTEEMLILWGDGYSTLEYKKLETLKAGMHRNYDIVTESHKDYLAKICMTSVQMDKAMREGNVDHYKKLADVYDKLMKSAKFTAVQRTAADKTGGMNSFGELYEWLEKQGFIPKFHTGEAMDIVDETLDNMNSFTKNLFYGDPNIANMIEASIKKGDENLPDSDIDDPVDEPEWEDDQLIEGDDEVDEGGGIIG